MKKRVSFTFDKETVDAINRLSAKNDYRNKSHFVESAVKLLSERELGVEAEHEEE